MSKPSVGQLINVLRNATPPAGFDVVLIDDLEATIPGGESRIEYAAYFNTTTNQIILSGTPKPQPLGGNGMDGVALIEDAGIFHDATVITTGSSAGRFLKSLCPLHRQKQF